MELEFDRQSRDWRALREDGTPCIIVWNMDGNDLRWVWVADGVQWKEVCATRQDAWEAACAAVALNRMGVKA